MWGLGLGQDTTEGGIPCKKYFNATIDIQSVDKRGRKNGTISLSGEIHIIEYIGGGEILLGLNILETAEAMIALNVNGSGSALWVNGAYSFLKYSKVNNREQISSCTCGN
jgi:hypothetical protein